MSDHYAPPASRLAPTTGSPPRPTSPDAAGAVAPPAAVGDGAPGVAPSRPVNDRSLRRLAGIAGLLAAVLTLIEVPLYFVYDGSPPDGNVLTRSLFGLLGLTCLIVFAAYLRPVLAHRDPRVAPAAALASVAGLMWVTIEFVSNGLETGAVIAAPDPIDPTIAVSGTYLLYGTTTRLVEALFLLAFGFAVTRGRALPRPIAWSAYLLALVNLAFVPSIYFGNDPANFYAANGWGTTATMGALFMLWLLAAAITVLRATGARATSTPDADAAGARREALTG